MPLVTIKTGLLDAEGHEEILVEYMCDSHDCPNIPVRVLGVIQELRTMSMVCEEHAHHRSALEPNHPAPRTDDSLSRAGGCRQRREHVLVV